MRSPMHVINWLELQPSPADLEVLRERLRAALPVRSACRLMVEITLRAYPWTGRSDLVACYHPSQTYKQNQKLALFIPDPQKAHLGIWLMTRVKEVQLVENRGQGRFQALTLEIHGKQIQMASGVTGASYPEPDMSSYKTEELARLVDWIAETYAASLQATLRRLIKNSAIRGRLAGETFLPEPLSGISTELLHSCFARIPANRPWISLDEIYKGLPDLSSLERETVLGLLRAALRESPYPSLDGDRWTTPELFMQLDRQVPLGLPVPRVRSQVSTWTKQDEQDLAGYDGTFIPAEARRALEELGLAEWISVPDATPWHPPDDPLRLPALSYLHITQAYFPVHSVMSAFAPDVRLVFLQFLHGDHEPFLLDREHGLLKAIHPEGLHARILEEDTPAGTYLWLEYQGGQQYRIATRPLPFKRRVPCKLASREQGQLHIAHVYISMKDEGNPSLFKADLRFEEIESLSAGARQPDQSLRATIGAVVQEICATDPDHRAHESDIFNAVFLTRLCSPTAVSLLLYTQPCFESLGGGYFRYKPMADPIINPRKGTDRLSRLWNGLLADPVAPHPLTREKMGIEAHLEVSYAPSPLFSSDRELPSLLRLPEAEPEISVTARAYATLEDEALNPVALDEEERMEPILLSSDEPGIFSSVPMGEMETERDSLDTLFQRLVEPEQAAPSLLAVEEASSESEALSEMSVGTAHVESLSFSSPFRWEPKPAWVNTPSQSKPPVSHLVDPRQFASRPRIPVRPLHKQPFYRRLFFYLHRWLSGDSRKAL